ncbi:hypothetical protein [Arthrobacter sp. B10-11]|jgi:hypothetical protein|uniref:hypothetical protein n=1 Tax=Arthrobacter sp. B10-11 TaxID=3081160 RepID=UPI002953BD4E|nr:hypothetical protein [Arthrobacter sp. B10-11]MDV8148561.1 hypothetical protein [Arthrobacter sp. B10-11]
MTQPSGTGPVPPNPQHPGGAGNPPAYGELYRGDSGSWRLPAAIAAAGIPVGLLWWLLAPGGLNLLSGNPSLASGTNAEGWLPRDLVLAGLFLLAGCVTGFLLNGKRTGAPMPGTVLSAVVGGALGALIAWQSGVLAGQWWGPDEDTAANASIAFSLRAFAVLAIWPAAVAIAVFVANLISLLGKPPEQDS